MRNENLLEYQRARWLRGAGLLSAFCMAAYVWHEPVGGANGGTWLGYTLGGIGALLIVWLLMLGLRKRAYRSGIASLRGWVSAHVYLGTALLIVVTLHTGFQFGWNLHTLAYVLMVAVIASGAWGVVVYLRNPSLMSDLLDGKTLEQHLALLGELDGQARSVAGRIAPRFVALVDGCAAGPVAATGWRRLQRGIRGCPTTVAVAALKEDLRAGERDVRELSGLLMRRLQQLARVRAYLRAKAWTEAWLLLHVPLSLALLAALIAHIVAVFTYW